MRAVQSLHLHNTSSFSVQKADMATLSSENCISEGFLNCDYLKRRKNIVFYPLARRMLPNNNTVFFSLKVPFQNYVVIKYMR
jgi:hypothetical protein